MTGQRAALLPALEQRLLGLDDYYSAAYVRNIDYLAWLNSGNSLTLQALNNLVQETPNQLTSVREICANRSSEKVLLIVWLGFAACVVAVLAANLLAQCIRRRHPDGASKFVAWPRIAPVLGLLSAAYDSIYGLAGLTFYYYDLVTSIIVLTQVWGTWPGGVLTAIFFFHFAVTGVVVGCRLICWRVSGDMTRLRLRQACT